MAENLSKSELERILQLATETISFTRKALEFSDTPTVACKKTAKIRKYNDAVHKVCKELGVNPLNFKLLE